MCSKSIKYLFDSKHIVTKLVAVLIISIISLSCSSTVKFADSKSFPRSNSTNREGKPTATKARKLSPKIEDKKSPSPQFDNLQERFNDLSELRERLIDHARGWMGVPYRWGGNSKSGVDCSGLIVEVFKEESYMLPRTAAGQFSYLPIINEVSELETGDLVFFSYDGTHINHVGICTGYGSMIHASSSRGVVEDGFLSGYFGGKFAGGGVIG